MVLERSWPSRTRAELRDRGHLIDTVPADTLGKVCAVGFDPAGFLVAGAGHRGRRAYAVCG